MLDAVAEERTVGEARKRVVERVVLELVQEGLALGDVACVEDDALDAFVVQQIRPQRLGLEPCAVHLTQADLDRALVVLLVAEDELEGPGCLVGLDQLDEAGASSVSGA
jgi:hypothetical protein